MNGFNKLHIVAGFMLTSKISVLKKMLDYLSISDKLFGKVGECICDEFIVAIKKQITSVVWIIT